MAGIIDYIKWRGDLDFNASPFNPVDNLIISELSYMKFADILRETDGLPLKDVASLYLDSSVNNLGLLLTGDFNLLLELMAKSCRYGDLILKECVEIIDETVETQFSAMTVELSTDVAYIVFRGTDDTLVGWKEDFKMSFLDVVPAQKEAVTYVNRVAVDYGYNAIYIGGHSKGGNLAVYSAIHGNEAVKDKIITIFNNDGPGFKQQLLDSKEYKDIANRVLTFIPQSSIVGMLLEHEESYQVVQSSQKGALQHDGFSWKVMGADFVYLTDVDDDSIMVDMTIKKVLNTLDLEQREAFTNTIFDIISVNENRTLVDIRKDGLKSLYTISKNYKRLDKNTKKAIHETVSLLFGEGFRSFLEVKNADQWNKKLSNWRRDVHEKFEKHRHRKEV